MTAMRCSNCNAIDDLEARIAKLEAVAEVDVRDMANFCIAQGASKPW